LLSIFLLFLALLFQRSLCWLPIRDPIPKNTKKYMLVTCPHIRDPIPKNKHQNHCSNVNALVLKAKLPN